MLSLVRRSFANLDSATLPLLFKTMVRLFLEYGNLVWGPFGKTDQKKVEQVQRRATRLVEAIRHLPYSERLRALKLPSLLYRRRRGDMIAVYQMLHGGMSVTVEKFLARATSGRTLGHEWSFASHVPDHLSAVTRSASGSSTPGTRSHQRLFHLPL